VYRSEFTIRRVKRGVFFRIGREERQRERREARGTAWQREAMAEEFATCLLVHGGDGSMRGRSA